MDSEVIVNAGKVGSNRSTRLVQVDKREPIKEGSEEKYRTRFKFERRGERRVQMVIKVPSYGADHFLDVWRRLKEADIPTIPTVRRISDDEILITDMTADGSGLYGKDSAYSFAKGRLQGSREAQVAFLSIPRKEIEEQVIRLATKVSEAGLLLPRDDSWKLWVRLDGTWQLIVFDISEMWIPDKKMSAEDIVKANMGNIFWVCDHLDGLRKALRESGIETKSRVE